MDGFAGYKTAATKVIPDAVTVMDPFHVVALAGIKLDLIRQRIQQQTLGRRGHTGDPLYGIRRIARTRLQLLSTRQYARLTEVLDGDEHLAVKIAWLIYQNHRRLRRSEPASRQEDNDTTDRVDSPWRADRIGGDLPARPHPMAPARRHPGLLRPPRLQRTHRSHQRPPGSLAPQRPRLQKPHPLPLALTPAQRRTPPTRQCTLNYEEPVIVCEGDEFVCVGGAHAVIRAVVGVIDDTGHRVARIEEPADVVTLVQQSAGIGVVAVRVQFIDEYVAACVGRSGAHQGPADECRAETGGSDEFLHSSGFLFVCFVCRVSGWPSVSSIPSASKANLAICPSHGFSRRPSRSGRRRRRM